MDYKPWADCEDLFKGDNFVPDLYGCKQFKTTMRAKRSINIPAGIPVNSFIRFRPETDSGMKNPVLD